jgi:isopenicillin N synthase-like dioxygenase
MIVVDYKDPQASQMFADSLRDTGFAVLKNFPIDLALIEACYTAWHAFFAQDLVAKEAYAFSSKTHDGYVSPALSETAKGNTVKDLKEFYHYYLHGRCPESQRAISGEIFHEMLTCATVLLSWVEKHCPESVQQGFSMPLSEMITESTRTLLRLIHYPPLQGDETLGAIRAAAHADINLLTLLPAASEPGLQLLTKSGEWIDVPFSSEYLIINIGDMLQECSGGYYQSTQHRVINPEGMDREKARMSMPLFLHPRDDVRLSERYLAEEYRQQRFRELGLAD